ncbi:MAG: VacB/RNase II family 3'-5' exoribonuclease [Coriobacteriales bacterium]|nr:VacB/RNase II family 3'-5' exoribonuclease [Coriobacteriales bacterium]
MARRSRKGRRRRDDVSVGTIQIAWRGYAFVDTPEGSFFVLPSRLNGAMDGDLVEVVHLRAQEARRRQALKRQRSQSSTSHAGEEEGSPVQRKLLGGVRRVLERAHQSLVGILEHKDGLGVVVVADGRVFHDVFLDPRYPGKPAHDGDVVVVQITSYPSRREACAGYIIEVVGGSEMTGIDIEMIIRRYRLETRFTASALEEARAGALRQAGGGVVEEATDTLLSRRDLRERLIFSIDPADARDFDDALSVDYLDGRLRLGVHIADVSAYVPWDSSLDLDARRRGTSVYLPDRVVPMLPPELSDDVCSLRPNSDRLAFSVDLFLRADGSVEDAKFYPSLIHSRARLNYDQVQAALEKTDDTGISPDVLERLFILDKLARKLTARRERRGALDFDTAQMRVVLNAQGTPVGVRLRRKNRATALVEEAMIAANEAVAACMLKAGAAMIYRIHDEPLQTALDELMPTLREFGYALEAAPRTSLEIQELLLASRFKAEYDLVSTLLLRAMRRARYHSAFTTHFGLASAAYTHFTSPIRRYPDLMVHRLLRYHLARRRPPAEMLAVLDNICEISSDAEQRAEAASLDAHKLKLCEFLSTRIGQCFRGIISGVNSHGFYVREDGMHAEGFVERDGLDAGFCYEATRHRWVDHASGRTYRLGQTVDVELAAVDIVRSYISFVLR